MKHQLKLMFLSGEAKYSEHFKTKDFSQNLAGG